MKKQVILGLTFLLSLNLMGFFAGNESCKSFSPPSANGSNLANVQSGDPCDPQNAQSNIAGHVIDGNRKNPTIAHLVALSGGYYFKAAANYNNFISLFEFSDIFGANPEDLKKEIVSSLSAMQNAHRAYSRLLQLSRTLPYNQAVINWLLEFDYLAFQKKHRLNSSIMLDVQAYLSAGDVRGIYSEFHRRTGEILEELKKIKDAIDVGDRLELSMIWRLNQKFAEFKLFGQYIAEVFYEIK